jgi:lipopolysaccharide transport system ATP-binding protein
LAGATTSFANHLRTANVAGGSTALVRFEFTCSLLTGVYFLNAGVMDTETGIYLHRTIDGIAFRVAPVADRVGTGLIDLSAQPSVTLHSAGAGADIGRAA